MNIHSRVAQSSYLLKYLTLFTTFVRANVDIFTAIQTSIFIILRSLVTFYSSSIPPRKWNTSNRDINFRNNVLQRD